MTNSLIIPALKKRRIELATEIEHAQNRLRQLALDITGLDATIRLFDSDYHAEAIKSANGLYTYSDWRRRGDMVRIVFDIMRQAEKPLTTNDIVSALMASRGLDGTDRRLFHLIRKRVGAALRDQRPKGTVRSQRGPGLCMLWEINQ